MKILILAFGISFLAWSQATVNGVPNQTLNTINSNSITSNGSYLSGSVDSTGGGPNNCPIWFWGDNTCQEPTALLLNTNLSGDLSNFNNELSGLSSYAQFTHTGTSEAFPVGISAVIDTHGNGPYAYVVSQSALAESYGSGHIDVLAGNESVINLRPASTAPIDKLALYYGSVNLVNSSHVANSYGAYIHYATTGLVDNAFSYWSDDLGGLGATNPYYLWFNSNGVRRVKEDSTFNSVGQAIEALYNPQITKYVPGAANFERVVLGQWNSNVAEIGTEAGGTGTLRNLRLIGPSTNVAGNLTVSGSAACVGCTLSGTTAAIGGSALLPGACAAGTATVTGAASTMVASASPSSDPDSVLTTGISIYGFVSSANTVTVRVCAIVAVTPASTTYNVRVTP